MTICIGAIANDKAKNEYVFVTVSDLKVTKGFYSGDLVTIKTERIHPQWWIMLAGKIAQRHPIIRKIMKRLDSSKTYVGEEIAAACTEEYVSYQRQCAAEKVLSPFNLTFENYLTKRQELGDVLYERLWNEISRIQIGLDLLVVGFTGTRTRIFTVSNPTEDNPAFVTYCDDQNFAAIGTGSYLAESIFFWDDIGGHTDNAVLVPCGKI